MIHLPGSGTALRVRARLSEHTRNARNVRLTTVWIFMATVWILTAPDTLTA